MKRSYWPTVFVTFNAGEWDAEICRDRIDRAIQLLSLECLYPWLREE